MAVRSPGVSGTIEHMFGTGFDHLTKIDAVIIIRDQGKVIVGHYCNSWSQEEKQIFEEKVFAKWEETTTEHAELSIFELDNMLISYSRLTDCTIFIVAKNTCNELILDMVQEEIYCVLDLLFDGKVSQSTIEEQIEKIYFMFDELFEHGFIVESSADVIAARVLLADDNKFESNH